MSRRNVAVKTNPKGHRQMSWMPCFWFQSALGTPNRDSKICRKLQVIIRLLGIGSQTDERDLHLLGQQRPVRALTPACRAGEQVQLVRRRQRPPPDAHGDEVPEPRPHPDPHRLRSVETVVDRLLDGQEEEVLPQHVPARHLLRRRSRRPARQWRYPWRPLPWTPMQAYSRRSTMSAGSRTMSSASTVCIVSIMCVGAQGESEHCATETRKSEETCHVAVVSGHHDGRVQSRGPGGAGVVPEH